jgi:SAM-dependent methyltransferase
VSRDKYRCTFDSAAETYERSRPLYAESAIDWVEGRLPFGRVLDLGAGTGKLTRQLVARGTDVVAVEPGDGMRAVLEREVPGVVSLAGEAEAIPLRDGDVDAVVAGQAFHWFRTEEALGEMHRVLRQPGGFALFWIEWDEEDPLMHALNDVVETLRPDMQHRSERPDWWKLLEGSTLFGELEERRFRHAECLDPELVVERVRSVSAYIAAEPAERARVEAEVRALVGEGDVDFPLVTIVVAADRV